MARGGFLQHHPAIRKMLKLGHPKASFWLNVAKAHDLYEAKLRKVLRLQGGRRTAFSYANFRWHEERLKLADAELSAAKAALKPIPWAEFVADGFCTEEEFADYMDVELQYRPVEPVPNTAQLAHGGAP